MRTKKDKTDPVLAGRAVMGAVHHPLSSSSPHHASSPLSPSMASVSPIQTKSAITNNTKPPKSKRGKLALLLAADLDHDSSDSELSFVHDHSDDDGVAAADVSQASSEIHHTPPSSSPSSSIHPSSSPQSSVKSKLWAGGAKKSSRAVRGKTSVASSTIPPASTIRTNKRPIPSSTAAKPKKMEFETSESDSSQDEMEDDSDFQSVHPQRSGSNQKGRSLAALRKAYKDPESAKRKRSAYKIFTAIRSDVSIPVELNQAEASFELAAQTQRSRDRGRGFLSLEEAVMMGSQGSAHLSISDSAPTTSRNVWDIPDDRVPTPSRKLIKSPGLKSKKCKSASAKSRNKASSSKSNDQGGFETLDSSLDVFPSSKPLSNIDLELGSESENDLTPSPALPPDLGFDEFDRILYCPSCKSALFNISDVKPGSVTERNYKEILVRLEKLKACSTKDPITGTLRWNFLESSIFCSYHRAQITIIPQGIAKGYKDVINWSALIPRVQGLQPILQEIIDGKRVSTYRQHMLAEYQRLGAQAIEYIGVGCYSVKTVESRSVGYYGRTGAGIIFYAIDGMIEKGKGVSDNALPQPPSNALVLEQKSIAPQSLNTYIESVLVPESALILVAQDYGMFDHRSLPNSSDDAKGWRARASSILAESFEFGITLFPDDMSSHFLISQLGMSLFLLYCLKRSPKGKGKSVQEGKSHKESSVGRSPPPTVHGDEEIVQPESKRHRPSRRS